MVRVQAEAGVWVGLPGQIKEFDALAKSFAKDPKGAMASAEKAMASASAGDADYAKYYVKVMTKLSASKEFITKESERLQKMIEDGSVKANKKEQFGRRLNILSSFQ